MTQYGGAASFLCSPNIGVFFHQFGFYETYFNIYAVYTLILQNTHSGRGTHVLFHLRPSVLYFIISCNLIRAIVSVPNDILYGINAICDFGFFWSYLDPIFVPMLAG